jgi:phosphoribosyl-ATP pyrophosphohydrolase/phosphoribosyl-AMP cyclohydrolase
MIVPSIDLQGGQAVQLIGGEKLAIEAGDPHPIASRFAKVGEIAVIDLDAAIGSGANRALIESLCASFPCRVGGGIRDEQTARHWLDAGARKIILGTAAQPELLRKLPRERVIAALDAVDGEVVVHGWRTRTGARIEDRMEELRPHVGGFLITFVEREGRLQGTAMDRVAPLVKLAGEARVTIAGGVTTAAEIADLDTLGADAQVGMALYTGRISLAEAFAAPIRSDRPDGLWPTVVVDPYGRALGQCYSNLQSLTRALETGRGVYWSRSRGLWEKGATSGATQELLAVDLDCDRDTLRMTVRQEGAGFCHNGTTSCWGPLTGLPGLAQTLATRLHEAPAGSYTRRLLDDPELLRAKLLEEAAELSEAEGAEAVIGEVADVLYFALVAMVRAGVSLDQVEQHLDARALKVSRRPGNAKPQLETDGSR